MIISITPKRGIQIELDMQYEKSWETLRELLAIHDAECGISIRRVG